MIHPALPDSAGRAKLEERQSFFAPPIFLTDF